MIIINTIGRLIVALTTISYLGEKWQGTVEHEALSGLKMITGMFMIMWGILPLLKRTAEILERITIVIDEYGKEIIRTEEEEK